MVRLPIRLAVAGALLVAAAGAARSQPVDPLAEYLRRCPPQRLAECRLRVADFDGAAAALEEAVAREPGAWEAPRLLSQAARLRLQLGQPARALADAQELVRRYGAAEPRLEHVAATVFALGEGSDVQASPTRLREHHLRYLRDWSARGAADLEIVAHVRLAAAHWRASCPVTGQHGACTVTKPVRARWRGCRPSGRLLTEVVRRRPAVVAEAERHLALATRLGTREAAHVGGSTVVEREERRARMLAALAQARFLAAEKSYEEFLAIREPAGLDFDTDPRRKRVLERSTRLFTAWLEAKNMALLRSQAQYLEVIALRDPYWAIAGLARIGELYAVLVEELDHAVPVKAPKAPRGMRQRDFDRMFESSTCHHGGESGLLDQLARKAIEAFTTCARKADELRVASEWSRLCAEGLAAFDPRTYPPFDDIRPEPAYVKARIPAAPARLGGAR